jgi:hypothetical protein
MSHKFLGFLATLVMAASASTALAVPNILAVVETGGDNELTDTIPAKWTGTSFPVTVANEPVNGLVVGNIYNVGLFGNNAPSFVDRNHRYVDAPTASFVAPLTQTQAVPIPSYLVGGEYIMSGNDNRDNPNYRLDVTVAQDSYVFMLIDNRLKDLDGNSPPSFGPEMQWIVDEGWEPVITGNNHLASATQPDEVGIDEGADGTTNQFYAVYFKEFSAGTFSLRQADNASRNMYGVVITPAPIPEPSTFVLAAIGLSTLVVHRRVRRVLSRRKVA